MKILALVVYKIIIHWTEIFHSIYALFSNRIIIYVPGPHHLFTLIKCVIVQLADAHLSMFLAFLTSWFLMYSDLMF